MLRVIRMPRTRWRPFCIKVTAATFIIIVIFSLVLRRKLPRPTTDRPPIASYVFRRAPSTSRSVLSHGVPRIIHQTWKTQTDIPETFRPWMNSWLHLNPSWEYWFWTDSDIRNLIAKAYPDYLPLFDRYPAQGYRVDIFRYFVLYEYGGLYVDLDMECLRPIDEILDKSDCLLSQEPVEHAVFLTPLGPPLVSNALMACRPRHPFFADVISGLPSYVGWLSWNDVLRATGPYMLTSAYRSYSSPWRLSATDHSVKLASADDFQPSPDDSMVDYMRRQCIEPSRRQMGPCDRLMAYDFGRSRSTTAFTLHHWTHSWVGRRNDPYGLLSEQMKRFSVRELTGESTS